MPSVSEKQERFMALCKSRAGRKKARQKCPPMKVALEYHAADKTRRRAGGRPAKKHA